jgi:HemY protein
MLATATDPLSRNRRAEGLASAAPGHIESHILLARVALAAGLLGEAQRHADDALKAGTNQRRVWLLLAAIAAKADNPGAQSEALMQAAAAAPDPSWRCGACGTVYPAWAPTCAHCSTSGQIAWGVGPATGARMLVADGGETILP